MLGRKGIVLVASIVANQHAFLQAPRSLVDQRRRLWQLLLQVQLSRLLEITRHDRSRRSEWHVVGTAGTDFLLRQAQPREAASSAAKHDGKG